MFAAQFQVEDKGELAENALQGFQHFQKVGQEEGLEVNSMNQLQVSPLISDIVFQFISSKIFSSHIYNRKQRSSQLCRNIGAKLRRSCPSSIF